MPGIHTPRLFPKHNSSGRQKANTKTRESIRNDRLSFCILKSAGPIIRSTGSITRSAGTITRSAGTITKTAVFFAKIAVKYGQAKVFEVKPKNFEGRPEISVCRFATAFSNYATAFSAYESRNRVKRTALPPDGLPPPFLSTPTDCFSIPGSLVPPVPPRLSQSSHTRIGIHVF